MPRKSSVPKVQQIRELDAMLHQLRKQVARGEKLRTQLAAQRPPAPIRPRTKPRPVYSPPALPAREPLKRGPKPNPNSVWQRALALARNGADADTIVTNTGCARATAHSARWTVKHGFD